MKVLHHSVASMAFVKMMKNFVLLLHISLLAVYYLVTSLVQFLTPKGLRRRKDIGGQKVLITGAGSGVGRQLAVEFSKHATCLILVDINRQSLLQTEKLLDRRSAVFSYVCDVSDHRKVYEMAEKVKREAGDVDILVNNAGIVAGRYLLDLPEEKIVRTMEVNALAHFWTCKAFLPAMMKKNRGHVVCIASIAGRGGGSKASEYIASKFAAIGIAECVEAEMRELELDGIKVTIVCPSHIDTGLFRGVRITVGSPLTPEYVAKEIVLGVLEEREIIYIPVFFRFLCIMKEVFPRKFTIDCYKLTGNLKVMEHFTGRETNGVTSAIKPIGANGSSPNYQE